MDISNIMDGYVDEYRGEKQVFRKDIVSVKFHPTVVEVRTAAFSNCRRLTKIVLNEGLMKIGNKAFDACISLQSIVLPSALIEIGDFAFQYCLNLREVVILGERIQVGKCPFNGCDALERIEYPILSARLENIIQTSHYPEVENNIDEIRGVIEREDSELYVYDAAMHDTDDWNTIKASLDQIVSWIRYYEIKEATSLFELALWKARIDQVDDSNPINREACQMEVPGPIKETILQYL